MGQNKWRYSKKNPYLDQSEILLERGSRKTNPPPPIQTVVRRPNTKFAHIQNRPQKEDAISSGTGINYDLPDA